MMNKNKYIIGITLVALCTSFITFLSIEGDNNTHREHFAPDISKIHTTDDTQLNERLISENNKLSQEIDTLREQQALLFSRLDDMSKQFSALSASLDVALSSQTSGIDSAENNDTSYSTTVHNKDQQYQSYEVSRQEKMVLLEESFYDEGIEEGWSSVALDEINSSLEKLDDRIRSSVSLSHAECHTTICRLEVNFEDENADSEFFTNFALTLAWNTTAFYERLDSPGENRSVIYLSRDGHALPIDP